MSNEHKKPQEITIPSIDEDQPQYLYQGATLKIAIDTLEQHVESLSLDPSIPADDAHFGSFARKIGIMGAAVERTGKAANKEIKAAAAIIDDKRIAAVKRIGAIKTTFLAPRVAYAAEVAAHAKALNDSLKLMQHGHLRVGEFSAATEADWVNHVNSVTSIEVTESLFGDRFDEAVQLKKESIDLNNLRLAKFKHDAAALAAGREALKLKQDAEAAERHNSRTNSMPAPAAPTAPAARVLHLRAAAVPAAGLALAQPADSIRAAKIGLHRVLIAHGMEHKSAVALVNLIEAGGIRYVKLVV